MFLRVCSSDHEWGFEVPDGCIPAVGDEIVLWYAIPDTEDTEEFTDGIVIKREWSWDFDNEEMTVCLQVELNREIPEGYIADSPVWPSIEESKRKAEFDERLAKFRKEKQ